MIGPTFMQIGESRKRVIHYQFIEQDGRAVLACGMICAEPKPMMTDDPRAANCPFCKATRRWQDDTEIQK